MILYFLTPIWFAWFAINILCVVEVLSNGISYSEIIPKSGANSIVGDETAIEGNEDEDSIQQYRVTLHFEESTQHWSVSGASKQIWFDIGDTIEITCQSEDPRTELVWHESSNDVYKNFVVRRKCLEEVCTIVMELQLFDDDMYVQCVAGNTNFTSVSPRILLRFRKLENEEFLERTSIETVIPVAKNFNFNCSKSFKRRFFAYILFANGTMFDNYYGGFRNVIANHGTRMFCLSFNGILEYPKQLRELTSYTLYLDQTRPQMSKELSDKLGQGWSVIVAVVLVLLCFIIILIIKMIKRKCRTRLEETPATADAASTVEEPVYHYIETQPIPPPDTTPNPRPQLAIPPEYDYVYANSQRLCLSGSRRDYSYVYDHRTPKRFPSRQCARRGRQGVV